MIKPYGTHYFYSLVLAMKTGSNELNEIDSKTVSLKISIKHSGINFHKTVYFNGLREVIV